MHRRVRAPPATVKPPNVESKEGVTLWLTVYQHRAGTIAADPVRRPERQQSRHVQLVLSPSACYSFRDMPPKRPAIPCPARHCGRSTGALACSRLRLGQLPSRALPPHRVVLRPVPAKSGRFILTRLAETATRRKDWTSDAHRASVRARGGREGCRSALLALAMMGLRR